jgi:5-(carboxyamino)imidazole ribonucleotide mutase
MPPGIPVATVGIDGAKNAAYLAARMLARKFPEIKARLEADLAEQRTRYDDPFATKPTSGKRKAR